TPPAHNPASFTVSHTGFQLLSRPNAGVGQRRRLCTPHACIEVEYITTWLFLTLCGHPPDRVVALQCHFDPLPQTRQLQCRARGRYIPAQDCPPLPENIPRTTVFFLLRFYFRLFLTYYPTPYSGYCLVGETAQSPLSMAMTKGVMEVREAVVIIKDLEMRGKHRRGPDQKAVSLVVALGLVVADPSKAYVETLNQRFWQIQIHESEHIGERDG
ncbi:uncharacterized protein LY79DRAFT_677603, partial [Colletotrichum navitas]